MASTVGLVLAQVSSAAIRQNSEDHISSIQNKMTIESIDHHIDEKQMQARSTDQDSNEDEN